MKSGATPKDFPKTPEEWEKIIAEAPGVDRPTSPEEEQAFWDKAVFVRSGGLKAGREALAEKRRQRGERGPQKTPTKMRVTLRLSQEVIKYFKAKGAGWQTRIDDALKAFITTFK